MRSEFILLSIFCLAAISPAAVAQSVDPQAQVFKQFYDFNKRNIIAAAEKMPAGEYGFKPASEVRSYAELLGHIADGNYLTCSPVKGEQSPNKEDIRKTEKTAKTKDDVVKALKASFDYCDAVFSNLTDATLKETYKQGEREQPKARMVTLNVYHGGEHYGNVVVYLRLKGIVPPSSETIPQPQQPKTENRQPQFDLDHYQFGLLKRGPKWTAERTPETQKIQEGHMANINKMAKAGKLMAAGPMGDNGDLRGIFIFKAASLEEARTLAAEDPAIQSGRLTLELMDWMGTKGIGAKLQEESKVNPNPKYTMTIYYLALLSRGPKWAGATSPENQKLQLDHLWHVRKMMDAKTFVAAGPFDGKADLRGIFVIAARSSEEARAVVDADPAVKSGHLTVELRPWYVAREVWP
jgi:uncharacterized protein YciI/uncharacterized damage-inducible protein DinB